MLQPFPVEQSTAASQHHRGLSSAQIRLPMCLRDIERHQRLGFLDVKSGAGTLVFSATNTYTGATFLDAGTLDINNAQALGNTAAAFTINVGTTIDNGATSGASHYID